MFNLSLPIFNTSATSKSYVDAELNRKVDYQFAMLIDGGHKMSNSLDMNNKRVINVEDPINNQDVVTRKFMEDRVSTSHIQPSTNKTNVFSFVMDDVNLWGTEYKTKNLTIKDKDVGVYQNNHKVVNFEIERRVKHGTGGLVYQYQGRITVNCSSIPQDKYTVVVELFPKYNINSSINISSGTLTVDKQTIQTFTDYTKSIINLNKLSSSGSITITI